MNIKPSLLLSNKLKSNYKLYIVPLIIAIILFTVILVRNAWISDDAYVTYRVMDNFVNGYGLTWNTSERVETYTNPLWLFLNTIFYSITHEIYYTGIFLSIGTSIVAVSLFAFKISRILFVGLLGIAIFIFSQAFVDYTVSGLENPLTHVILALFFIFYVKAEKELNFKKLLILSLITGLAGINRFDTLVMFLPALFYAYIKLPKIKGAIYVFTGFLPLIIWKVFSTFYYGFPFSNTTYAKALSHGLSQTDTIIQGLHYFRNTIQYDPLTLIVIFIGMSIPFIIKKRRYIPFSIGIGLYLLFILLIGGDFMRGRFFTGPLFLAVSLIFLCNFDFLKQKKNVYRKIPILFIFTGVIIIGVFSIDSPIFSDKDFVSTVGFDHGVSDQRSWYYQQTGLLTAENGLEMPNHEWARWGMQLKEAGTDVQIARGVGMVAFYAGPNVYMLDLLGLGDPLLSKIPNTKYYEWIPGHLTRPIPQGYIETLKSGENKIVDKNLAFYYDKLNILTKGDLFEWNRIVEIWNVNTGKYDEILNEFRYRPPIQVDLLSFNTPKKEGTAWDDPTNIILDHRNGVQVNLDKIYKSEEIEISLDAGDYYHIFYYLNESEIANQLAFGKTVPGLNIYILDVPDKAVKNGYNNIRIIPIEGDGLYSIGHLLIEN